MDGFSSRFNALAQREGEFLSTRFLAPVVPGQPVLIRIAGIVLHLKPKGLAQGWGVFRPLSYHQAQFVRPPSMQEQRAYLDLFPRTSQVL